MRKLVLILTVTILMVSCSQNQPENKKITVACSITPLTDFAQNIGKDRVEAFTIVPGSANPHTFEMTPGLLKKIANSNLFVYNGLDLEFWADKVRENIDTDKTVLVKTSTGIKVIDEQVKHGDHFHAHGNPHVWLNPQNAIKQVTAIKNAMQKSNAQNADFFDQNAQLYINKLDSLDRAIEARIETWSQKSFVCFHPAWAYFAERYGLIQAAVIEERHGSEPSPQKIKHIIETLTKINAKALFVEAQFPSKMAETIANETGIKVIGLDPLGALDECQTYIDLLNYNVNQMEQALK